MAEERLKVTLLKEPRGKYYQMLLQYAVGKYPTFLLVVRPELEINIKGRKIQEDLGKFLLCEAEVLEWPGTKILTDEKAKMYKYVLNKESAKVLEKCAEGLFEWQQPDRPEDLCIIRSDGSPWLVCISHEEDAYFDVTAEEKIELKEKIGDILAI